MAVSRQRAPILRSSPQSKSSWTTTLRPTYGAESRLSSRSGELVAASDASASKPKTAGSVSNRPLTARA